MRVLIADDHTLVRAGIRRLLEGYADVEVVAEAGDGVQAIDLATLHRPDIALIDLAMPGKGGLEVTATLRATTPGVAVVIMSMHSDLAHVREALDRGAVGFVCKEAAPAELELAIRAAAAGQTFLSPQISSRMVDSLLRRQAPSGLSALSPRQRDILARLGRGQSTKEIAADLDISVKTVETHRARMMETLGCRRAADLIRFAARSDAGLGT